MLTTDRQAAMSEIKSAKGFGLNRALLVLDSATLLQGARCRIVFFHWFRRYSTTTQTRKAYEANIQDTDNLILMI
jgi:hypothetical protein